MILCIILCSCALGATSLLWVWLFPEIREGVWKGKLIIQLATEGRGTWLKVACHPERYFVLGVRSFLSITISSSWLFQPQRIKKRFQYFKKLSTAHVSANFTNFTINIRYKILTYLSVESSSRSGLANSGIFQLRWFLINTVLDFNSWSVFTCDIVVSSNYRWTTIFSKLGLDFRIFNAWDSTKCDDYWQALCPFSALIFPLKIDKVWHYNHFHLNRDDTLVCFAASSPLTDFSVENGPFWSCFASKMPQKSLSHSSHICLYDIPLELLPQRLSI